MNTLTDYQSAVQKLMNEMPDNDDTFRLNMLEVQEIILHAPHVIHASYTDYGIKNQRILEIMAITDPDIVLNIAKRLPDVFANEVRLTMMLEIMMLEMLGQDKIHYTEHPFMTSLSHWKKTNYHKIARQVEIEIYKALHPIIA